MRCVSRTHRVALNWFFDRINLNPTIQIKHVDTKNQLADILTKGNFTRDEWNDLLRLFIISNFSSASCSLTMSKRTQGGTGEESWHKVKTDDEPGFEDCSKLFNGAEFECIELPGDTQSTQSKLESYSSCGETCSLRFKSK